MMWTKVRSEEEPSSAEEPAVNYMVVVTGSELLTGVYADGHTHFLTRTLRPLGLHCVGAMFVDDNAIAMQQALKFACWPGATRHRHRRARTHRLRYHTGGDCRVHGNGTGRTRGGTA